MAIKSAIRASDAIQRRRILPNLRFIFAFALLALIVVCMAFAWITRDAMTALPFLKREANHGSVASRNDPVDVRPWETAEALAALAVTAEERECAREAEHLAGFRVSSS